MYRIAFAFLLALTAFSPSAEQPNSYTSADQSVCGDVEVYLAELDRLLFEGWKPYLEDEEWVSEMERAVRKSDASDSGFMTLTPEEMEPMIEFISVPGDVLLDFPEGDIPDIVAPLHESALAYWLIMPAMLSSVSTGGVFEALAFVEDLESAAITNSDGMADLTAECPDLIARVSEGSGVDFGGDSLDPELSLDLDDVDAKDIEGLALSILDTPEPDSE